MKVADFLQSRRDNWRELERHCLLLENRRAKTLGPATVERFGALYRAVCADLALADSYQLPPNTVHYLHQLVGRAHNQLYPSRSFNPTLWMQELLYEIPQRLFRDKSVRLAFALFWGTFLATMASGYLSPKFTEEMVGRPTMQAMEEMYDHSHEGRDLNASIAMSGFYVQHNSSIGLQCFSAGLVLGVGGLFITVANAAQLGTVFGHMATVPQRTNFFHFVTAHGPFELTAIVLASAAGMRLGFSIVDTNGMTRTASLRLAAKEAVTSVSFSVILFCLAAFIEGYISPSALPYPFKASVAVLSTSVLLFYFVILGYPRGAGHATR
ncbi:MAG TPA: stage II sporulation protein M [Pirellulales bacterium]|nr:stage II sporulation protein M [Pirellulales bacterium]